MMRNLIITPSASSYYSQLQEAAQHSLPPLEYVAATIASTHSRSSHGTPETLRGNIVDNDKSFSAIIEITPPSDLNNNSDDDTQGSSLEEEAGCKKRPRSLDSTLPNCKRLLHSTLNEECHDSNTNGSFMDTSMMEFGENSDGQVRIEAEKQIDKSNSSKAPSSSSHQDTLKQANITDEFKGNERKTTTLKSEKPAAAVRRARRTQIFLQKKKTESSRTAAKFPQCNTALKTTLSFQPKTTQSRSSAMKTSTTLVSFWSPCEAMRSAHCSRNSRR